MSIQINTFLKNPAYEICNDSAPTCIDLFCGAGGLSVGFTQAGGRPILAIDNDHDCIITYKNMFPICNEVICTKIEDWIPDDSLCNIFLICGGPPCQGFSLARGFRFVDDPRNHLYKEFVRIVKLLKPMWVVMENVPGIMSIGDGIILRQIHEDFDKIGYKISCRVINMAEYGVPQIRKRAIFVGSRIYDYRNWPRKTHRHMKIDHQAALFSADQILPYVTIKQAICDFRLPLGKYFAHRANSKMRGPRNRKVENEPAFTLRVRGDEFALCSKEATGAFVPGPMPTCEIEYQDPSNSFQLLMREKPPQWFNGNYNPPRTNNKPPGLLRGTRRLTTRELARLQTFPDWFSFSGTTYSQFKQIGNAVPPLFARQLFDSILSHST